MLKPREGHILDCLVTWLPFDAMSWTGILICMHTLFYHRPWRLRSENCSSPGLALPHAIKITSGQEKNVLKSHIYISCLYLKKIYIYIYIEGHPQAFYTNTTDLEGFPHKQAKSALVWTTDASAHHRQSSWKWLSRMRVEGEGLDTTASTDGRALDGISSQR